MLHVNKKVACDLSLAFLPKVKNLAPTPILQKAKEASVPLKEAKGLLDEL